MKKKSVQTGLSIVFLLAVIASFWTLSHAYPPLARWLGFKTIYPMPEQVKYPKYVHNPNTNLWAVQTGYGIALKDRSWQMEKQVLYYGQVIDTLFMGLGVEPVISSYSSSQAAAGCEFQYLDSAGAVMFYSEFAKRRDSINSIGVKEASQEIIDQQVKDSLFKREHTYQ